MGLKLPKVEIIMNFLDFGFLTKKVPKKQEVANKLSFILVSILYVFFVKNILKPPVHPIFSILQSGACIAYSLPYT